jgi:N-glycosylase/DNA lyase
MVFGISTGVVLALVILVVIFRSVEGEWFWAEWRRYFRHKREAQIAEARRHILTLEHELGLLPHARDAGYCSECSRIADREVALEQMVKDSWNPAIKTRRVGHIVDIYPPYPTAKPGKEWR